MPVGSRPGWGKRCVKRIGGKECHRNVCALCVLGSHAHMVLMCVRESRESGMC